VKRLATILIFVLGASLPAYAARPVTFCDVCKNYMISKKGDDVYIRCPGEPLDKPWMTFKDCKNPKVTRTATMVTITCNT
jgi:hypothetical protein